MLKNDDWQRLTLLQTEFGPAFGSQTLSMLLHVLALREKPETVLELGTGLGVTTMWIAAAQALNGTGTTLTVDDGSLMPLKNQHLAARIAQLFPNCPNFDAYMAALVGSFTFGQRVRYLPRHLDLSGPEALIQTLDLPDGTASTVDWFFCDFSHGPREVETFIATALALGSPSFNLFIDSASTLSPSFLVAELIIDQLRRGKIPEFIDAIGEDALRDRVSGLIARREFSIHHFVEKADNAQNSTMLIHVRPVDQIPYPPTVMR